VWADGSAGVYQLSESRVMWRADANKGRSSQVWPVDDLKPHVIDGRDCWCHPKYDEQDDILIHNSMDEREKFETGERKPS